MRLSILSSLLLASLSSVLADESADSDVLQLTADTFKKVVDPAELILVEFYAPWCGHCKALAPEYEKAATSLKAKNIPIAKVDCVDQADLCSQHGVSGYPTLKVFRNGSPTEYNGPRKADGITQYMVKQSLPAVAPVTAENHEEFKTADKVVAVLYASKTSAPAGVFSATAEKHREDYLFGLVDDEEVAKAAGVTPPSVVVYKSFDEGKVSYPTDKISKLSVTDLEAWLKDVGTPLMDEVSGENYGFYAESGLPLAYLFLDPTDVDAKEKLIATYKPVAQKFKNKVNFVWIDALKFAEHGKAMNIREAKWPAFVVQDMAQQLKFPHDQSVDISVDSVTTLVEGYLAGTLSPELKSEPIPASQDEDVFVLVSKQFDEVVYDDSKDVFVEFYAPWCGHCKRLKPVWDELAAKFADVKDQVVIAKMDATENDIPPSAPFRVSGFPTIKFKPAGSREFVDYTGDRSLDDMVAFVKSNAKNSLVPAAKESEAVEPETVVPPVEEAQKHVEL